MRPLLTRVMACVRRWTASPRLRVRLVRGERGWRVRVLRRANELGHGSGLDPEQVAQLALVQTESHEAAGRVLVDLEQRLNAAGVRRAAALLVGQRRPARVALETWLGEAPSQLPRQSELVAWVRGVPSPVPARPEAGSGGPDPRG